MEKLALVPIVYLLILTKSLLVTGKAEEIKLYIEKPEDIGNGTLCSSPNLQRLILYGLIGNTFPPLSDSLLAECSNIKYLEILDLEIEPDAFKSLKNLEELIIYVHNFHRLTKEYFAPLKNLTKLQLWDGTIDEIEPGAFCAAPNLKRIYLAGNKFGQPISKSTFENCASVTELDVRENPNIIIEEDAFVGFTNINLAKIESLNITHLRMGHLKGFSNIESLWIINSSVNEIDADFFADFTKLKHLYIERNNLTAVDLDLTAYVPNLVELNFDYNRIKSILIKHPTLEILNVQRNPLSDIDLKSLKEGLPNLKQIYAGCSGLSGAEAKERLRQDWPSVEIISPKNFYCGW